MIVLDTHVLVWWVSADPLLSKKAKAAIEHEIDGGEIVVSSISAWEIAMLVQREKLLLSMSVARWLSSVAQIETLRFHPVDTEVPVNSADLPGMFHKNPADRMIVATARMLNASLITRDEKIRAYEHVKTIW